jgi:hypothetical protein
MELSDSLTSVSEPLTKLTPFDYPLRSFISSQTRLVTRSFNCQLTQLTLIAFGVAWSRDWTMTSKLRVVEFGEWSSEMLYTWTYGQLTELATINFLSRVLWGG